MGSRINCALIAALVLLTTLACEPEAGPTGTPPVVQLMPDLSGYRVVEGATVQEYIKSLADGAALLSMNPEMLLLVERLDSVITCYREVGAINMRVYNDIDSPLSSGAIVIVDRERLTDPQTLLRCVGGEISPLSEQITVQPCAHNYTLERNGNTFQIAYVGTTREICEDFCSALDGCRSP